MRQYATLDGTGKLAAAQVPDLSGDFDALGAAAAAQAASQPLDSNLTALAGLAVAADTLPYGTGSHTMGLTAFTAAGRALVDDADAAAQRTTLGLGTAATQATGAFDAAGAAAAAQAASQPLDSDLTALAGLSIASDTLPYGNGSHTMALTPLTAAGRAIIDDADATAQRATLGLGSAALSASTDFDAAGAAAAVTTTSIGAVPTARTITAGTGLTGGGDLTANRSLAPDFGSGAGKVTQGNDARLFDSRAPNGSASGDLGGSYPGPTVLQASGTFALSGAPVTATTTGNIVDLAITNSVYRWNGGSAANLCGIAGGIEGRIVIIRSIASGQTLTIKSESVTETTAANRITLPGAGTDLALFVGYDLVLQYDGTTSRWRVTSYTIALGGTSAAVGTSAVGTSTAGARSDHVHATGAGTPSTQAFSDAATTGTGPAAAMTDHKHAMPVLGYGLSGAGTPAVGLTTASGLATATTAISAAAYADVTGATVSLAAGTWLVIGMVVGLAANLAFLMSVAITDASNVIVREASQFVPASGTASVNALGSVEIVAIVSPGTTTSYKLRAARGNTTLTNTWTAIDGSGQGVVNNASSNTDKGTGIIAVRLA